MLNLLCKDESTDVPYNTANVSQDFILEAESLNGLEDMGNVYLWTSKQPLSEHDLAKLQELAVFSYDIANVDFC